MLLLQLAVQLILETIAVLVDLYHQGLDVLVGEAIRGGAGRYADREQARHYQHWRGRRSSSQLLQS